MAELATLDPALGLASYLLHSSYMFMHLPNMDTCPLELHRSSSSHSDSRDYSHLGIRQ